MKYLVGAACVAIIAASGFIIGKPMYDAHAAQERAKTARLDAREAPFRYSRAEPNDTEKVESICKFANSEHTTFSKDMAEKIVNTCLIAGFSINY